MSPEAACLWEQTCRVAPVQADAIPSAPVDLAVVGAGYTGLAAALTAAEAGLTVCVIEAGDVGAGASGRNGGQVQAGFGAVRPADPANRSLADSAADRLFALIDKHAIDCDPVRAGLIRGINHPHLIEPLRQRAAADPALEFWDAGKVNAHLGGNAYHGAVFDARAGRIEPMAFARGLGHAARKAGARLVTRTSARDLIRGPQGWRIVTDRGAVTAERVILATNTYTDDLYPKLQRSLVPVSSFQIATEPFEGGPLAGGEIASDTSRLVTYWRRDRDGRLIIGGRGTARGARRFSSYAFLWRWLTERFPGLSSLAVTHYWAGRVGITVDHVPHLHMPAPGLIIACGYNGKGVALGTALGERLGQHAMGAPVVDIGLPVTPLRPVPFWSLRHIGVAAHVTTYRLRDRLGV